MWGYSKRADERHLHSGWILCACVLGLSCCLSSGCARGNRASEDHSSAAAPLDQDAPISLLILLDSSGSMKNSDPLDTRKLATETIASFLRPSDQVAVYQVDDTAKNLGKAENWMNATDTAAITKAAAAAGNSGLHTDFRAALEAAKQAFASVPEGRRKLILLLTDGVLEPNPADDAYAPANIEYKLAIVRSSRGQRSEIESRFRERLSPTARRIIAENILPDLVAKQIEIFSVALGPEADHDFLSELSERTSQHPTEVHSFSASRGTDLVRVFASIAPYWTDWSVMAQFEGEASQSPQTVMLDSFVRDPVFLTISDGDAVPEMQADNGAQETATRSQLGAMYTFHLSQRAPPGQWSLRFSPASGSFRGLLIGHNKLLLKVEGLKTQYRFGEPIRARVALEAKDGLKPPSDVQVACTFSRGDEETNKRLPEDGKGAFRLEETPRIAGIYGIRCEAYAKDEHGREITPRPSLEHSVKVLPSVYAEPVSIDFGTHGRNTTAVAHVEIHSGLETQTPISITGVITHASGREPTHGEMNRLPAINQVNAVADPGTTLTEEVRIEFPHRCDRGDFEGVIHLRSAAGDFQIPFRAHVPTIWEQVRLPLFILLILLGSILLSLVSMWALFPAPSGSLVPVSGAVTTPVRLSAVKRGVFARYLNFRRNQLQLSEIPALGLPPGVNGRLTFFPWKTPSLLNLSRTANVVITEYRSTGNKGNTFQVRPGQAFSLRNRSTLELAGKVFRYQNFRLKG